MKKYKFKVLKLGYYLFSITSWAFLCIFVITAYSGDGKVILNFNSIGEHQIETILFLVVLVFIVFYGFLDYMHKI